jgi:hypothetical protein
MEIAFKFVNYGERFEPQEQTLVLDVGMKTVPGVIDHHHPEAESECTASLIAKHPHLVLDHVKAADPFTIITHRLPDFDSLASIFLAAKLLETGRIDASMEKIAGYTKLVDSASLPKNLDLSGTPYTILRALFSGSKKSEEAVNRDRLAEGLKFMRFLYGKAEEGLDIVENRRLFAGIDRYEQAMRKVENDYFAYLSDFARGQTLNLMLPRIDRSGRKKADGLLVSNPRSFLTKEWAKRDKEHPQLGDGFGFLMSNFSNTRFILGVDPEQGINLKGLGGLVNEKEREKRIILARPMTLWYEGNCPFFNYRIIDSPQDGTALSRDEILEIIRAYGQP